MNTGTPRGFSLQNMGVNMMGFNQNAMMNMNMNMQNMAAATGFMPGANFGNPDGASGHTGGPVRRGGRNYGNRSGPYDRNQRNVQRGFNNVQGMINNVGVPYSSIIAQGGFKSGGKWGENPGGLNALVPTEAVRGRSIRSYEDLDAQPAGGTTSAGRPGAVEANAGVELDY